MSDDPFRSATRADLVRIIRELQNQRQELVNRSDRYAIALEHSLAFLIGCEKGFAKTTYFTEHVKGIQERIAEARSALGSACPKSLRAPGLPEELKEL